MPSSAVFTGTDVQNTPLHPRSRVTSTAPSINEKSYTITEEKPIIVKRKFKDTRLVGEYEKPWLENKDPRAKLPTIIFFSGVVVAVAISAVLIYKAYAAVPSPEFCLAWEEDFKTLDPASWNHLVQIDGFGTGSFDWTTTDPRNSYVDDKGLHIVPTLTTHDTNITVDQLFNGYKLNLTRDGTCTDTTSKFRNQSCWISSNYTYGSTIPPIRSARLTTAGKHSIRYGRVEVVAKAPRGDWLWPAIWMMPENNAYGPWPASGEIDITEWRGNPASYKSGGIDTMASSFHWGPTAKTDQFDKTTAKRKLKRDDFASGYKTYGLEWTPEYMFMYLGNRLNRIARIDFPSGTNLWDHAHFSDYRDEKGKPLVDTWTQTGRPNTPFDQPYYLILNCAVGAKNAFFPDGQGGKPWTDTSPSNVRDFALANSTWYPTWDKEGFVIKSVKMWNLGACPS